VLDVALQAAPGGAGQCAEPPVEPELCAVVSDEVEHREHRLVACPPQPATELLQEQRRALCRSEEQHGVDVGQI